MRQSAVVILYPHRVLIVRVALVIFFLSLAGEYRTATAGEPDSLLQKQRQFLSQLLQLLPPDPANASPPTPLDATWRDWLQRSGELPPDFNNLPSLPFLPDPMILDEGKAPKPVTSTTQWKQKRTWIQEQIKHWISGTFPPAPDHITARLIREEADGRVTLRTIELTFGPDNRARLTIELMVPPGEGPFPVFMTQWNHRGWAQIAVRRGYIGCVYAGADAKDDSETYAAIWYPQYDFSLLMRRAWGAFRALDYLHTLTIVDTARIAISGHSRNGKQSLLAAAFDQRIKAVVSSSGGTAAEVPYRYSTDKYDSQSILEITDAFPQWLHPRLRFFIGREQKLPVDQNLMMALVAPRGLMLSSALSEGAGNPWGIELAYRSAQRVYKFLNAENKIAVYLRHGRHGTAARDIEMYMDFFDYVFGRSKEKPENYLYYNYSFDKWKDLSGEQIDPLSFQPVTSSYRLIPKADSSPAGLTSWEEKKKVMIGKINWVLGEQPPGITNPGPKRLANQQPMDDYLRDVILRPGKPQSAGHAVIGPYHSFADYLYGNLYYPLDSLGQPPADKLPVVIYLHEYDHTTGFARRILPFFEKLVAAGFAVFSYDMIGFGTRIEEGTNFFRRYPHWSKLGKMVADLRGALDALSNLDMIEADRIYTVGYTLGGTVGLFAAALDERIAGLATVCGFTPLRSATAAGLTEAITAYSHLHGLLPRLGFFVGYEQRLPIDFPQILAVLAPRPHLIIAPELDKDAVYEDVREAVMAVSNIYQFYRSGGLLTFQHPQDYNHLSEEMQAQIISWLSGLQK